ncbi:beta strand repeat-containing protein, partial [Gilvibacter sediminis]|uniref:beta strand repeat-containing protein n=1 Tax=Gilvibacter sediminis TaxID=379071 RepID=UPI003AF32DD3|nr:hypothetical protein [Gilvibacter sediminis]
LTYTDEDGADTVIDLATIIDNYETVTVVDFDGTTGLLTYTDENGDNTTFNVLAAIDNFETLTTLSDNGDGTLTYTDEDGADTVIDLATIIDNYETVTVVAFDGTTGLLTYTDENGDDTTFNVFAAIDNFETLTTLSDNGDGTLTYTDEDGADTVIDLATIIDNYETVTVVAFDGTTGLLTYTDENGDDTTFNVFAAIDNFETLTTLSDNGDGTLTYTDEDGADTVIDLATIIDNYETVTVVDFDGTTGLLTYTDENGDDTTFNVLAAIDNFETLTTLSDNGDGTLTYTDEDGADTVIDLATIIDNYETVTVVDFDGTTGLLTYTDENGDDTTFNVFAAIDNFETLTTLSDNGDGTLTYTDEDGADTVIDLATIIDNYETVTDLEFNPTTGILTYTDENGTATDLDIVGAVDGSETIIVDGQNTTINGTGTAADPYSVDVPDNLDNDSTNEFNTGIAFDGTTLTVTDGGGDQSIDISGVSTDDQEISTDGTAGNIEIEDGNTITLNVDDADADATNEFNTGIAFDGTTLTVTDGGGDQSIDISGVSTDDQEISTDGTAGNIEIEDGNTITLNVDDADADATNEFNTGIAFDGTTLTVTDGGGDQSIDISGVSTDDQEISTDGTAGNIEIEDGNTITLNVDDADADATNEFNTGIAFDGTTLTVTDGGGDQSIDISGVSTDDQEISTDGTAGNIEIEDGNTITLNVDDADADATNEFNTGIAFDGTTLTVTDGGGDQSIDISGVSTDDQEISTDGTAGNIEIEDGNTITLNVDDADADATNEFNTGIAFDGTTLTVTDGGGDQSIDISGVSTDDQEISTDGTAGNIEIEDGNTITLNVDDADADATNEFNTGIAFDGTTLTVTDGGGDQSIDISGVSTDDQEISTDGTAGNIEIEDGNTITLNVDDADADATNEFNTGIAFDGTTLTVTDAGGDQSIDISGVSTDDQEISTDGTAGNIEIEDGNTITLNVDDADADATNEFNTGIAFDGTTLTVTDGGGDQSIDISGVSTDDQEISTDGTAGNIEIEDGNTITLNVDDADADATNEFNTGIAFDGTTLTVTDGGGDQSIDISGVSTDDQEISTDGTAGNIEIEDGNTITLNVDDADADATNEFNTGIAFDGTTLTVTDAGGDQSIDISGVSTDDQEISTDGTAGNIEIEDGNTITLNVDDADADATNEFNTGIAFDGTTLTVTDGGGDQSIDISGVSTDDQEISTDGTAGNIEIEDGNTITLNVDDADADATNEFNTGIAFDGTTLTVTDGGGDQSIDISGVSTDDQEISTDGTAGNIEIEDGNTITLNVDDADADATNEFNTGIAFDGTTLTVTDAGGDQSIDISGVSTDDQEISTDGTAGNIEIEDGNTITLNVDDADADATNEFNTGIAFDGTTLTVTDAGGDQSIDISGVSTDDQEISTDGTAGNIEIEDGNTITLNVDDADADATNEFNTGIAFDGTTLTVTDAGGDQSIDISGVSTDDQEISTDGTAGNIEIEDGNTITLNVDDADADATNEFNTGIAFDGTTLTVTDGGGDQSIDISGVSTDDQEISTDGTAGNIEIEDGNTITLNVDDADADATNEFNTGIAFDGTTLTVTDGGGDQSIDISGVSTDDQEISTDGTAGNIEIEDGNTITLNVDDADADATNEFNTGIAFDGTTLTVTDAGGDQSIDISGVSTDDQEISTDGTAGNIEIEDGNTITLNVDDADADATNEFNTGIAFDGTTLTVTDGGGDQSIDISG